MSNPAYFESVRQEAVEVWNKLQDPVLAGPWHQLFHQVQSPRHVLSELLQNADDAGATFAAVQIQDDAFVFEHNGEDFSEDHFRSLCRFGYSNKRALHTIGFRGVGFKSTFSLGDIVELNTPTLAVCFHASRWTEPCAMPTCFDTDGKTRIRVKLKDSLRRKEIESNLQDWLANPLSLLFFKNLRSVTIGETEMSWKRKGVGPLPDSHWMSLHGGTFKDLLLLRSAAEPFPEDALAEIRCQRMIESHDDAPFPPCRVEIVLGAEGRLFVVLPTGVQTKLPFASNAPFMQDPARTKIQDPEISPTNRWLLERIGKLAASSMLAWLQSEDLTSAERAKAYEMFPDARAADHSLEGVCEAGVREAFARTASAERFLLADDGTLVGVNQCVSLPEGLRGVWELTPAARFFDNQSRPALCGDVSRESVERLRRWKFVECIDAQQVIKVLGEKCPPKPPEWKGLMRLWAFLKPHFSAFYPRVEACDLAIVPVQSCDDLRKASEVVRIGEKKLLQSDDDWDFLARFFLVLNQNWPRFLADQRRNAEEFRNRDLSEEVDAALLVMQKLELADTSGVDDVVERAFLHLLRSGNLTLQHAVRLTQIAAKLGAQVKETYRYFTRDGRSKFCSGAYIILFDPDGHLARLLPDEFHGSWILHPDYTRLFHSCTKDEWIGWVASARSRIRTFVPPKHRVQEFHAKHKIELEAKKRGVQAPLEYPYKPLHFAVDDWDFDDVVWSHWTSLSAEDPLVWVDVIRRILVHTDTFWSESRRAKLFQIASTGSRGPVTREAVPSSWIMRFRNLPCLPDTHGYPRKPSELLRRTAETEPLLDVEPFIDRALDTDANRQLLDLLGVSDIPTGPDKILSCVRSLAAARNPPHQEVERWYRRLDQLFDNCSTDDARKLREAFRTEKLIWASDGTWANSTSVFQAASEEDVPGAPVIRPSVADLSFWRKIGVPDRPTVELALQWLAALPVSEQLAQEDLKRVRGMMARFPQRIWDELQHWLNLSGEWVPTGDLSYAISMQSLVSWQHLFPAVRKRVADLRQLGAEPIRQEPFSRMPSLASLLEERLSTPYPHDEELGQPDWLAALSDNLIRVELDLDGETNEFRNAAFRLHQSSYVEIPGLEVVPYLEGTPAGTARKAQVAWVGNLLCVDRLTKAKLAKAIPEELGKVFGRSDIKAALDYSVGRSSSDIHSYFAENFKLAEKAPCTSARPEAAEPTPVPPPVSSPVPESPAQPPQEAVVSPPPSPAPKAEVSRPRGPSLIERFAVGTGFRKMPDGNFQHEDGRRVLRLREDIFEWGLCSTHGVVERRYWVGDVCFDAHSVSIEAEVWAMVERDPDAISLVLTTRDGRPQEMPGAVILDMRNRGIVTVHPAAYRLVKIADS